MDRPDWKTALEGPGGQAHVLRAGRPGMPGVAQAIALSGAGVTGEGAPSDGSAQWLTTVYTNALKWKGVEKVFWAFFRDLDNYSHDGTDNLGLVRLDFSEKPGSMLS